MNENNPPLTRAQLIIAAVMNGVPIEHAPHFVDYALAQPDAFEIYSVTDDGHPTYVVSDAGLRKNQEWLEAKENDDNPYGDIEPF